MLPVSTTPRTLSGRTPRPRSSPAKSRSSWPASASRRGRDADFGAFPDAGDHVGAEGGLRVQLPAAAGPVRTQRVAEIRGDRRRADVGGEDMPPPEGGLPRRGGERPALPHPRARGESAWTVQLPSARAQQASRTLESCSSVVSSRFSSAERGRSSPVGRSPCTPRRYARRRRAAKTVGREQIGEERRGPPRGSHTAGRRGWRKSVSPAHPSPGVRGSSLRQSQRASSALPTPSSAPASQVGRIVDRQVEPGKGDQSGQRQRGHAPLFVEQENRGRAREGGPRMPRWEGGGAGRGDEQRNAGQQREGTPAAGSGF